jgi:tRNA(Ile)-lysidine synthase TilS/MesJ
VNVVFFSTAITYGVLTDIPIHFIEKKHLGLNPSETLHFARNSNLNSKAPASVHVNDVRERVLAFAQVRRMFVRGSKVLVATGGGARSLGLMNLLASAKDELELGRLAVASVEPHADDETSDAAEVVADVGRLARTMGLDFYAVRPSFGREGKIDLHSELLSLTREHGFDRIALGNTRDDDAVRVMCELSQHGFSSVRGLCPRIRGGFVRPFLVLSDAEALRLCPAEAAGWPPGVSTPLPDEETVRKEVLPRLRKRFPGVDMMLQELGRTARHQRRAMRGAIDGRGG